MAGTETRVAPTRRTWTNADTHALWSWIERDPDLWGQMDFKGEPSHVALAVQMVDLLREEQYGRALLAAIEEGSELVGLAALTRIQPDRTAFAHIAISPDHRGRGTEIAKWLVAEAFRVGFTALVAQVTRNNPRALAFVERIGFGPMPYEYRVIARQTDGN